MATEETRVTDWVAFGHYGFTHYRIWHRISQLRQQQRHEWMLESGSIQTDEWIETTRSGWPKNTQPLEARVDAA